MLRPDGASEKVSVAPGTSLRDEVREALRAVLLDSLAPAAAKVSAARTLMEFFDDERDRGSGRRLSEMLDELDQEIARLSQGRHRASLLLG
jgi:hypothetical protein